MSKTARYEVTYNNKCILRRMHGIALKTNSGYEHISPLDGSTAARNNHTNLSNKFYPFINLRGIRAVQYGERSLWLY